MEVVTSGGVWGDVPSWISSGATLFALLFAAVAAVAARRTYRIESERDRTNSALRMEQEAYGRRSQASLISVWWGVEADPGSWGAFVRNASGAPVFQVSCTVLRPDDGEQLAKAFHAVVPPSLAALFEDFGSEVTLASGSFNIAFCRVRISFTDAAGIRWERNEYGRLTELRSTVTMKSDLHRARALELFAGNFQNAYGVEVAFEVDPDRHPQKQFMADVTAPEVADALICPHDWIGALDERDHLEPLILSPMHSDAFESWALDAFRHDGRLFGIPISTDTVSLFRNTAFAPDVPATIEQLIATGQKLCDDGTVQEVLAAGIGAEGDPFQTWPVFTSAGGWLFEFDPVRGWDPTNVGLASPGSIRAFQRFGELGEAGQGILRRDVDHEASIELFTSGRSAFLLSTSDALARAQRAGVPVEASAVPPFRDGSPPRAFSLVHGIAIAKRGPNKSIAQDLFSDYLSHDYIASTLSANVGCPTALKQNSVTDENIRRIERLCRDGYPMPTFAAMEQVWRILGRAQAAVIAGASAGVTARRAAAEVIAAVSSERARHQGL